MSSSLKTESSWSTSNLPTARVSSPQVVFKHVTGLGSAKEGRFEVVRDIFNSIIEPYYGPQEDALRKIAKSDDRNCLLLYCHNTAVGVIAYKNVLSNEFLALGLRQSFEIKTLTLADPGRQSGHGYGTLLFNKIMMVAEEMKAKSVHVTVSETNHDSLQFFKKKGFNIVHTFDGLYKIGVKEHLLAKFLQHGERNGCPEPVAVLEPEE